MTGTRDARAASTAHQFLQQFLRDREQGCPRTLAEYQARFPSHPEVIAEEFASVTEPGGGDPAAEAITFPAEGTRYRRTETIGRGGMGTVFRAFDPSLEREVAMKRLGIDDQQMPAPHVLKRFLEEAKVTGGLQHPGIVAVHELGLDADQRPYFTMPLIDGRTLLEIIDAVHRGDTDWTLVRALDVLVRVCETVAYAHGRGVVHRDLKPANVLVGHFGETYVVDWGLARVADRPDARDIRIRDADGDALPGAALQTMDGDVIGTPAYMAPEQARGEVDTVGARSDVYSLGAMLYHLLTGQPPYGRAGATTTGRETLERLLSSPPIELAVSTPRAPPELIAICERAMARGAEQRYATAADLGAELRAFLENRVVRAYASGPFVELGKWIRRNRPLAAASLIALLALVGGFAWSEKQRGAANENAQLANTNLELAFEAGEELLGRIGFSGLENDPGADPLRQALAREALAYFERLRDLRGDDVRILEHVTQAHYRIATLEMQFGHPAKAGPVYASARVATEELIARVGATPHLRRRLANIEAGQSALIIAAGDPEAGLPGLQHALAVILELLQDDPESAALLSDRCSFTSYLAMTMIAIRQKRGAVRYTGENLTACRLLAEREPDAAPTWSKLCSALLQSGKLYWQLGELDVAARHYAEGHEIIERALREHPGHRGLLYRRAELLNHHAILLRVQTRNDDARAMFGRAATAFGELAQANPGTRNYHGNHGGALCNLGMVMATAGEYREALPIFETARDAIRRALVIDPDASDFRDYRVIVATQIGIARLEFEDHAAAAEAVLALQRELPGAGGFKCGQILAVCTRLAILDETLDEESRASIAGSYADAAMQMLQSAAARGELAAAPLQGSTFDALRQRPDFTALLEQLRQ